MKNLFLISFIFFISCGPQKNEISTQTYTKNNITFAEYSLTDYHSTVKFGVNDEDKFTLIGENKIIFPINGDKKLLSNLQDSFLEILFEKDKDKYKKIKPNKLLQVKLKNYCPKNLEKRDFRDKIYCKSTIVDKKKYLKDVKIISDKNYSSNNLEYNFYLKELVSKHHKLDKILRLEYFSYIYIGGIHGEYGIKFYNIDLNTGKIIKFDDLFLADTKSKLNNLLRNNPIKDINDQSTYNIFNEKKDITLDMSDSFLFLENGIAFSFNPHSITPYYEGIISITIPYSAIKEFLRPEFRFLAN